MDQTLHIILFILNIDIFIFSNFSLFCSGAPLDIKNLYNLDNAARLTISEVCLNPKIRSKSNHDRKPIQGCRNLEHLIQNWTDKFRSLIFPVPRGPHIIRHWSLIRGVFLAGEMFTEYSGQGGWALNTSHTTQGLVRVFSEGGGGHTGLWNIGMWHFKTKRSFQSQMDPELFNLIPKVILVAPKTF